MGVGGCLGFVSLPPPQSALTANAIGSKEAFERSLFFGLFLPSECVTVRAENVTYYLMQKAKGNVPYLKHCAIVQNTLYTAVIC